MAPEGDASARRQRTVSAQDHAAGVPDEITTLLHRLIGGDPDAAGAILERATTSGSAPLLAAAALVSRDPDRLVAAGRHATTTRDRQLVALVGAHLRGDTDLFDVLVRDHLAEHPDSLLASWIAGAPQTTHRSQ
jgi:hypothetical protein